MRLFRMEDVMCKVFLPVASLVALSTLGCGPEEFKITGFVVEVTPAQVGDKPTYGFIDAEHIEFEDFWGRVRQLDGILDDFTQQYQQIRTKEYIKLLVRHEEGPDNSQLYEAVLGPTPGNEGETAIAKLKPGSHSIFIWVGWVYAYGTRPQAGTDWGDAGAVGSALLVHDRVVDNVFYLLNGDKTDSWWRAPLTEDRTPWGVDAPAYLIIDSTGKIEGPKPLDEAPADIQAFLLIAKVIVEAARIPWEGP